MVTAPLYRIDIAPYRSVAGAVRPDGPPLPADTATRLHTHLADEAFLAAVEHDPRRAPEGDVMFTLACTPDLRVLHADGDGELRPGRRLRDVEAELNAALGHSVEIWADPDGCEDLEDLEDDDAPIDEFDDTGYAMPEVDPGLFAQEPPRRVLLFSRRGISNGLLLTWLLGTDRIEAGIRDDWSVFRFLDHVNCATPEASRRELPSIHVSHVEGEVDGWAFVTVSAPDGQGGVSEHTVFPTSAAHMRAVLPPDTLREAARRVLSVLVNDHLAHDSSANELAAAPGLHVDPVALHAALAPQFPGDTMKRLETLLASLQIPADLVGSALHGEDLPGARTYTRRPVLPNLWQIALDGAAGAGALGGRKGAYRRFDDALRQRPALALALSVAEAVGGLALIVRGASRPGRRRLLPIAAGGLLVSDAALDVAITRARVRARRRDSWAGDTAG